MNKLSFILIITYFLFAGQISLSAQNEKDEQLNFIVILKNQDAHRKLSHKSYHKTFNFLKTISVKSGIYIVETSKSILNKLKDEVLLFQEDHYIQLRNTPNDPLYLDQWALDSIDAAKAWIRTNGGLSYSGDSIVCAIMDNAFDVQHEDLSNNIWKNYAEIPANGQDDDNNGFIDDFVGWNLVEQNDQHNPGNFNNHGTGLLGIIGAKGDNEKGITGINWNIKMLLLSAGDNNEILKLSNIITGFIYARDLREKYNMSNGTEGALVVAINNSWGIDGAKASDHPVWCALYDTLGKVGILSVAAASNDPVDMDIQYDMPCSCPSDYLITVSESNVYDQSVASVGKNSLDIFAPAETKTTRWNNNYGILGGTSSAAPHVSASVCLMYALPNQLWEQHFSNQPTAAAALIKQMILLGADRKNSFQNSVSGGRLNIDKSMMLLDEYFSVPDDWVLNKAFPNPTKELIYFNLSIPIPTSVTIKIINQQGQIVDKSEYQTVGPGKRLIPYSTNKLSEGSYFAQIETSIGQRFIEKFIKF